MGNPLAAAGSACALAREGSGLLQMQDGAGTTRRLARPTAPGKTAGAPVSAGQKKARRDPDFCRAEKSPALGRA